jgi:chromosome segregation ATPase
MLSLFVARHVTVQGTLPLLFTRGCIVLHVMCSQKRPAPEQSDGPWHRGGSIDSPLGAQTKEQESPLYNPLSPRPTKAHQQQEGASAGKPEAAPTHLTKLQDSFHASLVELKGSMQARAETDHALASMTKQVESKLLALESTYDATLEAERTALAQCQNLSAQAQSTLTEMQGSLLPKVAALSKSIDKLAKHQAHVDVLHLKDSISSVDTVKSSLESQRSELQTTVRELREVMDSKASSDKSLQNFSATFLFLQTKLAALEQAQEQAKASKLVTIEDRLHGLLRQVQLTLQTTDPSFGEKIDALSRQLQHFQAAPRNHGPTSAPAAVSPHALADIRSELRSQLQQFKLELDESLSAQVQASTSANSSTVLNRTLDTSFGDLPDTTAGPSSTQVGAC